jgi:small subunit ribosomal protein S4
MGHPRKGRKKYTTPRHPWQSERLEKEKDILDTYSLKNKKEIWKMQSILNKYTYQAKKLANVRTEQSKKEKEQIINKLFKMGLVKKNGDVDDILSLTLHDLFERRLQTLVYKKGLANTQKQARQFIVHGHIFVGDNKVSVPSYIVDIDEENKINFEEGSVLVGKFGKTEEEEKKKILEESSTKEKSKKEKVPKKEEKKESKKESKKEENKKPKKESKKEEKLENGKE